MTNENEKCVVPVPLMSVEIAPLTATGTGGTNDYNKLKNHPSINDVTLIGNKTLNDLNIQPKGNYITAETLNDYPKKEYVDKKFEGIDHDVENLTELYKEVADKPEEIYVGYINSITPGRDAIEEILEDAIKSGATTLVLRPTTDLPQDFTAISSGPNLQKYKNGGKGTIKFTDVNEHSTINSMPSVVSYVTTVSFTVTAQEDNIDVSITDVQTKFVSGINSTSQQAYVIHTKNEEEYIPTKDYHPAVKKYVDDTIVSKTLAKDNTAEYTPTTDYNPATKKYVDSIKDDIPTALSQLTNDLLNESDKDNFIRLSQENPGKFYFWGGEE